MCIVMDTADKMNVEPELVFDIWACFQSDIYADDVKKAQYDWRKRGIVSPSVTDFCLDILTDRIPLVAVPLPKQRAKNKLGEC